MDAFLTAFSHGGFFTVDLKLLVYSILLSASLASGLFAFAGRLGGIKRVTFLWTPVFLGLLVLILLILAWVAGRPAFAIQSLFRLS